MRRIADNIWLLRLPLKLMGCQMGRNVTIIRLSSGKLVLHSTAAFTPEHCSAIAALGEPGWLVEATNFHDTCTTEGCAAFPGIPYLAPAGLPGSHSAAPLTPPPPEWEGELDVIKLEGMPKINEHVFLHRPSATLIVADLIFNLDPDKRTRRILRLTSGIKHYPGISRFFRILIKDREAFRASLDKIRALPFERIIVAHGDPIEEGAKETFDATLGAHGY